MLNAAWKLDVGGPLNALSEVSQIKVAVPNMAQRVIDMAMQLHGGAGYMDEYPISRMFTDARVNRILAGSSEVMRLIIGRDVFSEQYKSILD